jgi:arylsulfatase A-like enzyme
LESGKNPFAEVVSSIEKRPWQFFGSGYRPLTTREGDRFESKETNIVKRKTFWLVALLTLLILLVAPRLDITVATERKPSMVNTNRPAERQPNIVFLLADDLGYCDVSLYDCKDIPTPNIDALAKNGIKFTQGYVSAPVCSPSRAGLMTGRYQQRFGFEFNAGPFRRAISDKDMGLPLSEITLPEVLKKAGYATGMVGKWHLGMNERYWPNQRGFEEFFGFLFGGHLYIDPNTAGVVTVNSRDDEGGSGQGKQSLQNPIYRNQTPVAEKDYLTDAFAREAVAYIDRHQKEPFFLYTAFNAPHSPFQATQKYLDRFPNVKDERRRVYMAMVSALDDAVGSILHKLHETGLEKDTLVVFLSDNGCATYTRTCTNDPLRFGKLTPFEGGIRVPFAMQWTGHLQAGTVFDRPISSLDLFTTAVTVAGGKLPKDRVMDGVNLLPYLTAQKETPIHDRLQWRNGPNGALRKENWKLIKGGDHYWLFDLSKDMGERKNLAVEHPEIIEPLKKEFVQWSARMKKPLWSCRKPEQNWKVDGIQLELCI